MPGSARPGAGRFRVRCTCAFLSSTASEFAEMGARWQCPEREVRNPPRAGPIRTACGVRSTNVGSPNGAEGASTAPHGCLDCEAPPGIRHIDGCPNTGVDAPELAYPEQWGQEN